MKGFLMVCGIVTVLRLLLYTGLGRNFKNQRIFGQVVAVHKTC